MSGEHLVVISARSFGAGKYDPLAALEAAGCRIERIATDHDLDRLRPALSQAHAWIAGTAPITRRHIEAAPELRLLLRYGAGVDSVDLPAAAERGLPVANIPGANAEAVADHTVGLALAALRHLVEGDRAVRAGDWSRRLGRELGSCRVGIVGYGAVGRATRRRLSGFGTDVLCCDPFLHQGDLDPADVELLPLPELVWRSDIVTLHAPPGEAPLIDAAVLAEASPEDIIVNTARASLLDEEAVAAALHEARLGACAVDVVSGEYGMSASPLLSAPRTIVTPHIAGQTVQAIDRMGRAAVEECHRVLLEGHEPRHPVTARKENLS